MAGLRQLRLAITRWLSRVGCAASIPASARLDPGFLVTPILLDPSGDRLVGFAAADHALSVCPGGCGAGPSCSARPQPCWWLLSGLLHQGRCQRQPIQPNRRRADAGPQ